MSELNISQMKVTTVTNDGRGASVFAERTIDLLGSSERRLSEQISAQNFRFRRSDKSFASDWHVAGDPTLLVILTGTVRIELRDGETKEFGNGEMFIAQDYLSKDVAHDDALHGHRAEVVGEAELSVLHLKLAKR